MSTWLLAAIVVVPLIAGLGLIGVLARGIYNHADIPNSNLIALGIAALLCIAPTLLNFTIKTSGGTEISVVKEQLQTQTQQIKNDFGAQGGKLNGKIESLSRRVAALEKEKGPAVASAAANPNSGKVVVVLHVEERKDLADQIQDYLLQEGYSANIVYTDFSELSDANRLASGAVAVVSAENNAGLRKEVEDVLRPKFSEMQNAVDSSSTKLVGTSVQVRLF
jgi:preprotein translocase subunit SecF